MRTTTLTIDTQALTHNLDQVKDRINPDKTNILAMVKADAYGHGIENCINALRDADALGVACFSEAKHIRDLGWQKDLMLIEGVFSLDEWHDAVANDCQSVIHHAQQVSWATHHIPEITSPSRTLWLKVNTGMNRIGFEPEEIPDVARQLLGAGYRLVLISHFANADNADHPNNSNQINIFKQTLQRLHDEVDNTIRASLCNSAGIINFPDCHFDWVRPGIMLYGSTPLDGTKAKHLNLKPVMSLQAGLMAIHEIKKGTPIGYGSRYIAKRDMVKGIVSIGYGDGYPRAINESAWVSLSDTTDSKVYKCPIIGRVAMDMLAIDLTHVPHASINSILTLWGNPDLNQPCVDDIAQSANTIGYELLCRVTQRPIRKVI